MTYFESGSEIAIFRAAAQCQLPVLLTGPTGCGKTRFIQHMAQMLDRPLYTVACHEDLTAGDLVGRFLLREGNTVWEDGPLTRAVRNGGICYLDEIVEARADTTVVIHPLADHRRELIIDRRDETLTAPPDFMLVASYNPGYQSILKDLKPSTRQRMVAIALDFPDTETEQAIIVAEAKTDPETAARLVRLGHAIRALKDEVIAEVASTRTLISAAKLISVGTDPVQAANAAIAAALTDDLVLAQSLRELVSVYMK